MKATKYLITTALVALSCHVSASPENFGVKVPAHLFSKTDFKMTAYKSDPGLAPREEDGGAIIKGLDPVSFNSWFVDKGNKFAECDEWGRKQRKEKVSNREILEAFEAMDVIPSIKGWYIGMEAGVDFEEYSGYGEGYLFNRRMVLMHKDGSMIPINEYIGLDTSPSWGDFDEVLEDINDENWSVPFGQLKFGSLENGITTYDYKGKIGGIGNAELESDSFGADIWFSGLYRFSYDIKTFGKGNGYKYFLPTPGKGGVSGFGNLEAEDEDTTYGRLEGSIGFGAAKFGGLYLRYQF